MPVTRGYGLCKVVLPRAHTAGNAPPNIDVARTLQVGIPVTGSTGSWMGKL